MRRALATLAAVAAFLAVSPTAHAAMNLPHHSFTRPPEEFGEVAAFECSPNFRRGTKAFANLVHNASGYGYAGHRDCDSTVGSPTSQHKTGRAVDLFIDWREDDERADGKALVQWLFRKDAAKVKRLGVVEIIWAGRIWTTGRDSENITPKLSHWRVFTNFGCPDSTPTECHLDHIHVTLSEDGSEKRTTFWTARATGA